MPSSPEGIGSRRQYRSTRNHDQHNDGDPLRRPSKPPREHRRRSRSSSPRRPKRRRSRSRSPFDQARGSGRRRRLDQYHSRRQSRSRSASRRRRSASPANPATSRPSRQPLPSQEEYYRPETSQEGSAVADSQPKEQPNFKPTGRLAAESNKVDVGSGSKQRSIALKYHEPPEARKPPASEQWMLYVFKSGTQEPLLTIPLHSRSCWLFGRETAVVDIPTEHPSCSKQHAVLQFRHVEKKDEWGERKGKVGLYLLDLESSNGTTLNGETVEAARYVQCKSEDVIKFGDSRREYVILLPQKS